jgi:serine/threonine protein kinase/tetratricopeptide (TPR) repeat protein
VSDEQRIADIVWEFCERRDAGEHVDPEQLLRDHPDLADELRIRLLALDIVDRAASEDDASPLPKSFGEYEIRREIGRGGMGVVYEAEQKSLKRRVALKVLSLGMTGTPNSIRRFQREAQAAARLHHTNIVPVYGLDQHAGQWYYAMELVEGPPLERVVAELKEVSGVVGEESLARAAEGISHESARLVGSGTGERAFFLRVAEMFAGVAEALELAHQEDVVHRDIKPSNLLLASDGSLRIVDFGLARVVAEGPSLTVTGDLLGTPAYMSPEQAMAKRVDVDHRTDVYSLGATLYEVLTLRRPFDGRTLQQLCSQIIAKDPAPPRRLNQRIPRDLETIVAKAMEKDPDRRYQTARELARDLRRFADGAAITARPIGPATRLWRKVKRHKVRSGLAATAALFAIVAATVALWATRESALRASMEYARLCARGYEALQRELVTFVPSLFPEKSARRIFTRAIELQPDRPDAYLGRSMVPHWEEAALDLERALDVGLPEDTYRLARICQQEGWGAGIGREWLQEAASASPENRYLAGLILANRGEFAVAERLLSEAIHRSTEEVALHHVARFARSRVRERLRDYSGALADLVVLQEAGDDSIETRATMANLWNPRKLDNAREHEALWAGIWEDLRRVNDEAQWFSLYLHLAARGMPWEVREPVVAEAYERFPDSPRILAARAAVPTGMPLADRIPLAERAVQLAPDSAFAWEALGRVCADAYEPDRMVRAFERAIELEPRSAWFLHSNAGHTLVGTGRYEQAIPLLEQSITERPFWFSYRTLARAQYGRGDYAAALASFEEAARLHPAGHEIRASIAHLRCLLDGDPGKAREALDKELARARGVAARCSIAWILVTTPEPRLRDAGRAAELARRAAEEIPKRGGRKGPWSVLGIARYRIGDWQGALEALQVAMDLDFGGDAFRWFFVAMAHEKLGRHEEAQEWYERATAWMEDHAPGHRELLDFHAEAAEALGLEKKR